MNDKIKGWKKGRVTKYSVIWYSTESGTYVEVYKEGIYWRIARGLKGDSIVGTYKSEAIKEAVGYMKSNPRGL